MSIGLISPRKKNSDHFFFIGVYVCPTCTETTGRRSACEFIESLHYVVASFVSCPSVCSFGEAITLYNFFLGHVVWHTPFPFFTT